MLETRMPPISARTRRSETPRWTQHSARTHTRQPNAQPLSRGNTALDPVPSAPLPSGGRPSARMNRLARSEMRLMGLATTSTAVVCGLLLLYLAAYAHVTQLGVAQADARARLRQAQTQNQMLRAERDRLESPQRILAAATAEGMVPRGTTTIDYIHVPNTPRQDALEQVALGREQGSSGGTTADSESAASFDH